MAVLKIEPQGFSLAYEEYGQPDGYPILVQHGLIASIREGDLFDLQGKAGARVICTARPGYGESSVYEMSQIEDWGEIAARLMDQLGLKQADVLGMSSGAPYSYAIGWRLGTKVRNLYIFSGIPAMYDDEVLSHWPFPVNKNASMEESKKLVKGLFFANLMAEDLNNPDTRDSLANEGYGIALDFRLRSRDWGFKLEEIRQPVFMRHARLDTGVPFACAELTAKKIPHCSLKVEESDIHFSKESLEAFFSEVLIPKMP